MTFLDPATSRRMTITLLSFRAATRNPESIAFDDF